MTIERMFAMVSFVVFVCFAPAAHADGKTDSKQQLVGKWQQTPSPKGVKTLEFWFTEDGRVVTVVDGAKADNSPYTWVGSDSIKITFLKGSQEPTFKVAIDGGKLTLTDKEPTKFVRVGDVPAGSSHKLTHP